MSDASQSSLRNRHNVSDIEKRLGSVKLCFNDVMCGNREMWTHSRQWDLSIYPIWFVYRDFCSANTSFTPWLWYAHLPIKIIIPDITIKAMVQQYCSNDFLTICFFIESKRIPFVAHKMEEFTIHVQSKSNRFIYSFSEAAMPAQMPIVSVFSIFSAFHGLKIKQLRFESI